MSDLNSTFPGERIARLLGCAVRSFHRVGSSFAGAWTVELADGKRAFVKSALSGSPFEAEAAGLRMLRVPGGVRVPEVLAVAPDLLVIESVSLRRPAPAADARFGECLAITHSVHADSYGFDLNHVIGSTPQRNLPRVAATPGAWARFWWEYRLEPLLRRLNDPEVTRASRGLDTRVASLLQGTEEPPTLLHGDLWHGNTGCDETGYPVMFDPAPYFGHREAELAMCGLFGGFLPSFYDAYTQTRPLPDGWRERQPLYRLYHVLNHLLLFGSAYRPEVLDILRRYA